MILFLVLLCAALIGPALLMVLAYLIAGEVF